MKRFFPLLLLLALALNVVGQTCGNSTKAGRSYCETRYEPGNMHFFNGTYNFSIQISNLNNQTRNITYEWFECRCDDYRGTPLGVCIEYWPAINYTGFRHEFVCPTSGNLTLQLGPFESKNISRTVTQYHNQSCGSFQLDLHIYKQTNPLCIYPPKGRFATAGIYHTCTDCEQPSCGDGRLDDGEECDDGNMVSSDGCTNTCLIEGNISICAVAKDQFGNISDGGTATNFTINTSLGLFTFFTPLTLNTDLLSNGELDSQCIQIPHLLLGNYSYDEEVISNQGWESPLYNDNVTNMVNMSEVYPFGTNKRSDGIIMLNPKRFLLIVNQQCPDSDNDTICDDNDLCPDSQLGEPVDDDGCDPFQFCERFACGLSCFQADWQDNENETFPNDCTVLIPQHQGRYLHPICVPTELSLMCSN